MRIRITSPDLTGKLDGTNKRQLLDYLPIGEPADVTVVPIAYWGDYQFNSELWNIKGPVVLIDYVEFGWDASSKENRFGTGMSRHFGHLANDQWMQFDDWVRDFKPRLTFKRELQACHQTETMLPIEYLCYLPIPPIQSRAEFEARPFATFSCFGYSHPMRMHLHADMIRGIADRGMDVITDWCQLENLPPATSTRHISIYSPYWSRKPMAELLKWQMQSKISVSLFGAGRKSFRSSEAPVGSIMAMPTDGLAHSYPWDESNSIQLRPEMVIEGLLWALSDPALYDIYVAGQENIRRYECATYVRDYVLPQIARIL